MNNIIGGKGFDSLLSQIIRKIRKINIESCKYFLQLSKTCEEITK
jgi:hypothetical protein